MFISQVVGYVLSRESLRRLVENGIDQNMCNSSYSGDYDDVFLGKY